MKSISTKRGDAGQTDLLGGVRLSKSHLLVGVLGELDELSACLGLVRAHLQIPQESWLDEALEGVQKLLIQGMGDVASLLSKQTVSWRVAETDLSNLEALGQRFEAKVLEDSRYRGWALAGASRHQAAAFLDLARCVCRRAERALCESMETLRLQISPEFFLLSYLNRLSDILWVLARELEREKEKL